MLEQLKVSGWPWDWLLAPLLALLGQPILLAELALLCGILLFSLGQRLGAPLQFFHEKPLDQAIAGLSATLVTAHVFFVIYLAEATSPVDKLRKPLALWFLVFWSSVVLLAAAIRLVSRRAPDKLGKAFKLSPALRNVKAEGAPGGALDYSLEGAEYAEVSPIWFLVGTAVALALLGGAARLLAPYLAELDRLAEPAMDSLGRDGALHPGLHLVALLLTVFGLAQLLLLRGRSTPAAAFCSLLALVATTIGASNYWFGASTIVTLLGLVLIAWVGREHYAIRLADLKPYYEKGQRFPYPPPERASKAGDEALLADALASPHGKLPTWPSKGGLPTKRPLILVCASGGGIRAATWTAGLLGHLTEKVPSFQALTLMITGASGGMVGAAYWAAERKRQLETGQGLSWRELTRLVSQESLTTITRTLVLNDVPRSFFSRVNEADRGACMQRSWQATASSATLDLEVPLCDLKAGELARDWPSLVFSPMIIEDGRRLLLSNLRLAAVAQAESLWLEDRGNGLRLPASHNAFHALDVFGDAGDKLTLATAARLSASFPYISPAVVLPTEPRTRVVDAGYYDNYGIDLATGWLREVLEHHAAWLDEHVSGILVLQIRDDESALSEGRDGRPKALPPVSTGFFGAMARGLEGLTTPLQGFVAARGSVMQLRNDSQLDAIARAYRQRLGKDLVHEVFELKGDLSLSWYLAKSELQKIELQLSAVADKVEKVANWVAAC